MKGGTTKTCKYQMCRIFSKVGIIFLKRSKSERRVWRGVIVCAASYMVVWVMPPMGQAAKLHLSLSSISSTPVFPAPRDIFTTVPPPHPTSRPPGSEALQHPAKLGRDGAMHWAGVQLQHPVRQTPSPVWKWQAGCLSHDLWCCCHFIMLQGRNDQGVGGVVGIREWSGGWCWSGEMEIDSGEVAEVVSRSFFLAFQDVLWQSGWSVVL